MAEAGVGAAMGRHLPANALPADGGVRQRINGPLIPDPWEVDVVLGGSFSVEIRQRQDTAGLGSPLGGAVSRSSSIGRRQHRELWPSLCRCCRLRSVGRESTSRSGSPFHRQF